MDGMMTSWKNNSALKVIGATLMMFLGSYHIDAYSSSADETCGKLRYNIVGNKIDHEIDRFMDELIRLYKEGRYREVSTLVSNYNGAAAWIPQHFLGAMNKQLGEQNPYIHLNSEYAKDRSTLYPVIIKALSISEGLIYQDYGRDQTPEEILKVWVTDENPDHLKYSAQVRSSNHYGGHRKSINDINYGSSLAHLVFLKENLGIDVAGKYITQVKDAINQLGETERAKNYEYSEKVLSLIRQCNSVVR